MIIKRNKNIEQVGVTYEISVEGYGKLVEIKFLNQHHTPAELHSLLLKEIQKVVADEVDFYHKVDSGYFDWVSD